MQTDQAISDLLAYAKAHLGMKEEDSVYLVNRLLEKVGADGFERVPADEKNHLVPSLPR